MAIPSYYRSLTADKIIIHPGSVKTRADTRLYSRGNRLQGVKRLRCHQGPVHPARLHGQPGKARTMEERPPQRRQRTRLPQAGFSQPYAPRV